MIKKKERREGYNVYRAIAEKVVKFKPVLYLSPNGITTASIFLLGLISYLLLIQFSPIIIVILFQLFIIMDYTDGSLAREKNKVSVLGEYLEFLHHHIMRIVIFIIPVFLYPKIWLLASLGLFFSLAIPNLRQVYQSEGGKVKSVKERGLLTYFLFNEFFLINTFCIGVLFKQIVWYYLLFDIYAVLFMSAQFVVYIRTNKKVAKEK